MTTEGQFSVTVNAAPEQVWPWVVDLTKHAAWSPEPYRVELVGGEAGAVGARYRSVGQLLVNKNNVNDVEVSEVDAPRRLVLLAQDKSGTFTNRYTLRPVGSGTEVTYDLVFPPMKGMAGVVVPRVFPLVVKPRVRKRMQLLKTTVEAAPSGG